MKKNIKWIFVVILIILFLLLGFLVLTKRDFIVDKVTYDFIKKFINNNNTTIIKCITNLGSAAMVIIITFITLIIFKNKRYGLFMSIDLIIITIIQVILKSIFGRGRPIDIGLIEESGYSFPSGHSLTAMAFYGFIIYLIYKSNIKYKKICITFLSIIIFLIGLSRVYLGVHFFTDVVGAFSFSLTYLLIYISIVDKYI